MDKVLLSLYCGSLFMLVFVVAPTLLRTKENKNTAGSFYGKILWRFYPIAFFLLLGYFILTDEKIYSTLLMLMLSGNVLISFWLKKYKASLGNIDLVDYKDPRRVIFRRVSILSTFVFLLNFLASFVVLLRS